MFISIDEWSDDIEQCDEIEHSRIEINENDQGVVRWKRSHSIEDVRYKFRDEEDVSGYSEESGDYRENSDKSWFIRRIFKNEHSEEKIRKYHREFKRE